MSGGSGAGATGGTTCGDVAQACCVGDGGETCNDNSLVCLAGASCSCAKTLFGRYVLRVDGALLYENDPSSEAQTPVLNANTGLLLANITDVLEGAAFGCAALSDGSVWCWRTATNGNGSGQLGGGTTDTSGAVFRATQVLTAINQPLSGVTSLAYVETINAAAACAITDGGGLYCWGTTSYLLNGGTAQTSPYAVPITSDGVTPVTGVVQVGIDGYDACAIIQGASSKDVWCWGINGNGQLGTGDTTLRRYPTKVVGISNPIKVVPFGYNVTTTCVLDGSNVRCWGANANGQVGSGTTTPTILAPTIVTLSDGTTPLGNIVDMKAGGANTVYSGESGAICALANNRTIQCWGSSTLQSHPTTFGISNVVALGNLDGDSTYQGTGNYLTVRVLTSDGLYHFAPQGGTTPVVWRPNCGLLQ